VHPLAGVLSAYGMGLADQSVILEAAIEDLEKKRDIFRTLDQRTRPDAIPPATVPMANGVSTDDKAKAAPNTRRRGVVNDTLRNANPAPRATMPSLAASSSLATVIRRPVPTTVSESII